MNAAESPEREDLDRAIFRLQVARDEHNRAVDLLIEAVDAMLRTHREKPLLPSNIITFPPGMTARDNGGD